MLQPKFIITSAGYLRLGMVDMHKDLLENGENCYGGGYYEFDFVANRLLLSGKSYDFGRPHWDMLTVLKVPAVYRGLDIVYSGSSGNYDVQDILEIEYYD